MAWEMKLVEKEGLSGPVLEVVAGLNQTSYEYMNKPGTWKHFQDILVPHLSGFTVVAE